MRTAVSGKPSFSLVSVAIIDTPKQHSPSVCLVWSVTGDIETDKQIRQIMSPALPRALLHLGSGVPFHDVSCSSGSL